jgi:hypothetical protein
MTTENSLLAWVDVQPFLSRARWVALQALIDHPGLTAAELEHATQQRHINKRLSELARAGLIEQRASRPCASSGCMAATWWPTSPRRPEPVSLSEGWKERALHAEERADLMEQMLRSRGIEVVGEMRAVEW